MTARTLSLWAIFKIPLAVGLATALALGGALVADGPAEAASIAILWLALAGAAIVALRRRSGAA